MMLSSGIIDVAIGLILVYLLLSMFCSTLTELIATVLGLRWRNLREGIRSLLDGASGETSATSQLYDHPLIQGLTQQNAWVKGKPSYIPSQMFMVALLDCILPAKPEGKPPTFDELRSAVASVPNEQVKRSLLALADDAGDIERFRTNIEHWFDGAMERVSGWYKRSSQIIILPLGLVLAIALNIDTIGIAESLLRDPALRTAVVSAAQQATTQPQSSGTAPGEVLAQVSAQIEALKLPIGWEHGLDYNAQAVLLKVVGWLLTAVAVSLGAPFWFDLLSKFIAFRGSGSTPAQKPPS